MVMLHFSERRFIEQPLKPAPATIVIKQEFSNYSSHSTSNKQNSMLSSSYKV